MESEKINILKLIKHQNQVILQQNRDISRLKRLGEHAVLNTRQVKQELTQVQEDLRGIEDQTQQVQLDVDRYSSTRILSDVLNQQKRDQAARAKVDQSVGLITQNVRTLEIKAHQITDVREKLEAQIRDLKEEVVSLKRLSKGDGSLRGQLRYGYLKYRRQALIFSLIAVFVPLFGTESLFTALHHQFHWIPQANLMPVLILVMLVGLLVRSTREWRSLNDEERAALTASKDNKWTVMFGVIAFVSYLAVSVVAERVSFFL
ncbi:MAG TPA: hypothetical protein ENJ84_13970 [Gammaproteobacteria bacterium]|nr:hypothetical protein [Gammaproteobacteria bacterium]